MSNPARTPRSTKRRITQRILITLTVAYALFLLLVVFHITDRLILFPTTNPLDTSSLTRIQAPTPTGGGVEIFIARTTAATTIEPQACVLTFIGNAARAELTAPYFAKDWADHPVEIWSVNYPGYGRSPGRARLSTIAPAALAAYDELHRRHPDKPIFLEARSIGTAAALHVAAHRPVAGLILHNPPPLRSLLLKRYGWWNLFLIGGPLSLSIPNDLDSLANSRQIHAPAVFVIAESDTVVPANYQSQIADAYPGPKQIIRVPDVSHTTRISGPALDQLNTATQKLWLNACPPPNSSRPGEEPRVR